MATEDSYPLTRNASASERLNLQHKMYGSTMGYHIHPSVLQSLPPSPRIADIATGTGIYLFDQAKDLAPGSQLDGFDISGDQFPEVGPANVKFYIHDARDPFPVELHGQYDFVHIRLLFSALNEGDWAVIATNVAQILKPGGAFQWTEGEWADVTLHRGKSATQNPKAMKIGRAWFFEALGPRASFRISQLPVLFQQAGFHSIHQDIVASDQDAETRKAFTMICYDGIFTIARKLVAANTLKGVDEDTISAIEHACREEIEAGCYNRTDILVTIGFKGN